MKKFCFSTYVAYMVVDYLLSCKELTALQSCRKKSLQNPDKTPGGVHQESIRSLSGVSGLLMESIRKRGGVSVTGTSGARLGTRF